MINNLRRHWRSGATFLAVYFGSQIFGASLWRFVVANVQEWWHRGAIGSIIGGIVGLTGFLWAREYSRREKLRQSAYNEAMKQGPA